jgi:hypothetical protein
MGPSQRSTNGRRSRRAPASFALVALVALVALAGGAEYFAAALPHGPATTAWPPRPSVLDDPFMMAASPVRLNGIFLNPPE